MELYTSKEKCCGCSACSMVCPKAAIKMQPDSEGFLYPHIENELCVDCGACKAVCAFQNGYEKNKIKDAYGVKLKDTKARLKSRSGGIFVALSNCVLKLNGTVYGAGYDENLKVCHMRITSSEDIIKLQGTKYVQSDPLDSYARVKNDLKNGLYVLYSGTSCQIGGLVKYLKNINTEKLITVDIICHGTPSPLMYREYLDYCSKNRGGKVKNFNFRDKSFGWKAQRETFWINEKKYDDNKYAYLFSSLDFDRPSCYKCVYGNPEMNRPSDFTIGDFWGVDSLIKGFNDDKGVSVIFVNTDKAVQIFEQCKDQIIYEKSDSAKIFPYNPNLSEPTARPRTRDKFWNDYYAKGFEYVMNKTYKRIVKRKVTQKIKRKLHIK